MAGPRNRGQRKAASRHLVQAATPQWMEEPTHFEPHRPRLAVRTAWISDTHLGTAGCNAELLLDFLKSVDCEALYLVGDIIDGWQLRKGWYWPPRHNDIVRCVLKKAKHGTRVIYVPGNHDEAFAAMSASISGASSWCPSHSCDGGRTKAAGPPRRRVRRRSALRQWLAFLGDSAYTLLSRSTTYSTGSAASAGSLLVAFKPPEEEGEERGPVYLSFEEVVALLRTSAEPTESFAGISMARRSGRSAT